MKKPILNVDDLQFEEHAHGTSFAARVAPIAKHLGARKLGARMVILPPGKKAWPIHNHHANEEMFFVLAGEGTLRYGTERFPLRSGDVVVTPTGGPETAHQIVNTSDAALRYMAISTMLDPDVMEYPDSGKFAAVAGSPPGGSRQERRFNAMVKDAARTDYWEDET